MTTVQALTTEAGETIKFRQFEIVDTGHIDTRRYKGVTEGGEPVELNCYCDSKGWEEYWKVGNRRFVTPMTADILRANPCPRRSSGNMASPSPPNPPAPAYHRGISLVKTMTPIPILDVGTNVIANRKEGTITNIKGIRILMYQVKFDNDKIAWFYENEVEVKP